MKQVERSHSGWMLPAVAIAAVMFLGFAKNYYLRAWLGTRPLSAMVHLHGLVMTSWVVLFLIQTLLVAKQRVEVHRKLGVVGAALAAAVVGLGIYTICVAIERHHPRPGVTAFIEMFVAFDGASLLLFGSLVLLALRMRLRPPIHRRLMLMAMISLLPPAYGRAVSYFTHDHVEIIVLALMCSSALSALLIDTLRHRRIHPAMAYGGLLVIGVNQLAYFAQVAD